MEKKIKRKSNSAVLSQNSSRPSSPHLPTHAPAHSSIGADTQAPPVSLSPCALPWAHAPICLARWLATSPHVHARFCVTASGTAQPVSACAWTDTYMWGHDVSFIPVTTLPRTPTLASALHGVGLTGTCLSHHTNTMTCR